MERRCAARRGTVVGGRHRSGDPAARPSEPDRGNSADAERSRVRDSMRAASDALTSSSHFLMAATTIRSTPCCCSSTGSPQTSNISAPWCSAHPSSSGRRTPGRGHAIRGRSIA